MDIILMFFTIIMIISFVTGIVVTTFGKKENNKVYINVPSNNNVVASLYEDMEEYLPMPIIEPDKVFEKPNFIEVLQFDNDLEII